MFNGNGNQNAPSGQNAQNDQNAQHGLRGHAQKMTSLPSWDGRLLTESDLARVHDAILNAESRTTGEIVPMLVRASSGGLKALFSSEYRNSQARRRAEYEFVATGITHTEARTGVLIFISLRERQVVVLGDAAIHAKVAPDAWSQVIADIAPHLTRNDFASGLCAAIAHAGELLAREFPAAEHGRTQLPTQLMIKD